MYPGAHATTVPDKPAYVMAGSGEVVTHRQLDERSNRLARLLHARGLREGDHVAVVMDNDPRFPEVCWAAQRSGLYYTPVNWHLTPAEMQYVVEDCGARALIASARLSTVVQQVLRTTPSVETALAVGGDVPGCERYEDAVAAHPAEPLPIERNGFDMLYSSGTTGRPKGGLQPLPGTHPAELDPRALDFFRLLEMDADTVYLMPGAPLYHAAPLRFTLAITRLGGTNVLLERFDPVESLRAIERHGVTHSQWVPTMFVRLLKLPEEERARFDLSSHRVAIHAAAPCPVSVKERMIEWWGPIVHEYYGGSEGGLLTYIGPDEWLRHRGSVGRPVIGTPHIVDEHGRELPPGVPGVICAEAGIPVEYHNDPEKTAKAHTAQGWASIGDIGYVDDEGYLYLTDRKDFTIISGGVNIYPQEIEDVLVEHPKVADVAVIGVPNAEFGEEVKAVVQPLSMADAGPALEQELLALCRERLAAFKHPRSVDFEAELPRSPAGKLYKRFLRDRYWEGRESSLV